MQSSGVVLTWWRWHGGGEATAPGLKLLAVLPVTLSVG